MCEEQPRSRGFNRIPELSNPTPRQTLLEEGGQGWSVASHSLLFLPTECQRSIDLLRSKALWEQTDAIPQCIFQGFRRRSLVIKSRAAEHGKGIFKVVPTTGALGGEDWVGLRRFSPHWATVLHLETFKVMVMTESVGPASAEGTQLSRCLPGKRFIIQDLSQPCVERPVEVPQDLLGDRPHGSQTTILGTPCVGRRTLGHQSFLLLT